LSDNSSIIKKTAQNTLELESKAIKLLNNSIDSTFIDVVNLINSSDGRVVITGIGKSGLIAMKIAATLNSTGTSAIFMHAADAIHGDLGVIKKDDVIICLSKSGDSKEIKELIPSIKFKKNTIIAITSNKSSFLSDQLGNDYEIFDVLNDDFQNFAKSIKPDVIINCIGRIKPTIDESDNISISETININSFFPMEIQKYSFENNSRYFQIGTDCVFSGKDGNYDELEMSDAEDLYGKSKIVGEILGNNKSVIRSSIIGPEQGSGRSLLNWFLNNESHELSGFRNHLWNGVTTLNFAKVINGLIQNENKFFNLQHLIPANIVTKSELLSLFKSNFKSDIQINEVDSDEVINRTLNTNNPENNESLWINAGYKKIPTIQENISELAKSNFTKAILN